MKRIKLPEMDAEKVADEIGDFIVGKVTKFSGTGGVIGLSGGVDSTTAAALAKRAFDSYNRKNEKQLELVGYLLPSKVNSPKDAEDGEKVAKKLSIRYELQEIQPIVEAYRNTNPEVFAKPYDTGNLMSRIRANLLSTKSATENKSVIGTGNRDEDFGIGYYTLFGDGAVHISPIGNLPKRLVREMARHLGFPELADRVPSAGLEEGQTDRKDLGYDYDVVELVIEGIEQGFEHDELKNHTQVKEMVMPQLATSKFNTVEDVVDDILKRHYCCAKPKAAIIHPPIASVTLEYR